MKKTLAVILLLGAILPLYAHKSWTFHAQDMYEVLQLEENPNLTNWMKYISSDLIDGYDAVKAYTIEGEEVKFGEYIRNKYPKLSLPHITGDSTLVHGQKIGMKKFPVGTKKT